MAFEDLHRLQQIQNEILNVDQDPKAFPRVIQSIKQIDSAVRKKFGLPDTDAKVKSECSESQANALSDLVADVLSKTRTAWLQDTMMVKSKDMDKKKVQYHVQCFSEGRDASNIAFRIEHQRDSSKKFEERSTSARTFKTHEFRSRLIFHDAVDRHPNIFW